MTNTPPPAATSWRRRLLATAAALVAFIAITTPVPVQADDPRGEVLIVPGGLGGVQVSARGQVFDIVAARAHVVKRIGDFVLVSAATGGSVCPGDHYWVDLSGSTPIITHSFGNCAEGLEQRPPENGTLVLRSLTARGPTDHLYRGGATVEDRDMPLLEAGLPLDASAEMLAQSTLVDLFTAAEWQDRLGALMGEAAREAMSGFLTGPGNRFTSQSGGWMTATGCARSLCSEIFAGMAIQPATGAVLIARHSRVDRSGFETWGVPDGPLPDGIADVQRRAMDAGAVAGGFARLSPQERRALQERLRRDGLYSAAIDGLFGPGTRDGIVALAARGAGEFGAIPDLTRALAVEAFLRAMLGNETLAPQVTVGGGMPTAPDSPAARDPLDGVPLAVRGIWECEGDLFAFSRTMAVNVAEAYAVGVQTVGRNAGDDYLILLEDGVAVLVSLRADGLRLVIPQLGRDLDCNRIE